MEFFDLKIDDLGPKCNQLYLKIIKDYKYDLVIFIAKGSYLIGKNLAEANKVPLLVISAERKGNKLKNILKIFLKYLPKKIIVKLRKKENDSAYHKKNSERKVYFDKNYFSKFIKRKKILLVDDSIDTGNSVNLVKKELEKYFVNSTIKIATLNVMKKSFIYPDYFLYEDTLIRGPWSSDSNENKKYLTLYYKWINDMKIGVKR